MLKSCSTCGKIHPFDAVCPVRIERERERQKKFDRSKYLRTSAADKFRSTKVWQRKRKEIKNRDLNICRCCFLKNHRITTSGLSVHHIVSLDEDFEQRLRNSNLITLCRECHDRAENGKISQNELRNMIKQPIKL